MAKANKWKYHKLLTQQYEIDPDEFYSPPVATTKEIKKKADEVFEKYFGYIEIFTNSHKLEGVTIAMEESSDWDYDSVKNVKIRLILKGYQPMSDEQKKKKDLKDKQTRDNAKLKKAQEKEEKELKERLEFERLKRKFGEE